MASVWLLMFRKKSRGTTIDNYNQPSFGRDALKIEYENDLESNKPITEETLNDKVCRVCIKYAEVSIFDTVGGWDITNALRSLANITINKDDFYPKFICNSCLTLLQSAIDFKNKCQESDTTFKQIKPPASFTFPLERHDFQQIIEEMRDRRLESSQAYNPSDTDPIPVYKPKQHSKQRMSLKKSVLAINTKLVERPPKIFKCLPCRLRFSSKSSLKEHRNKRSCARHPCPTCGKLVLNVASHSRIVHRRLYRCACHVCGKEFTLNAALRNHMLVHSENFGFQCTLCPYKGKQRAYLALHMRTHTGERPYLCSECPGTFVNASNLRKHQLVHTNKQFQCQKCKKSYRTQKSLQEHDEAAHLNMRYQCDICSKEFWYRSKLLKHELRMHNREKHKLNKNVTKVLASDKLPTANTQDVSFHEALFHVRADTGRVYPLQQENQHLV